MTQALYLDDSYLKEFEAKIVKVDGKNIILDKTSFYPASGGQPNDRGILLSNGKSYNVVNVFKKDGEIVHEVLEDGLQEESKAKGFIDWGRRYLLMRYHTAAHVLSGVFYKELGALITGNQLDVDKGRIDFDLDNFEKERIQELFDKANEIVKKGLKTEVSYLTREEALNNPDLFKLAKGAPENIKDIRILDIKGFDKQADGGTHVKSLKEIGTISLIKCENKGKSNRRVYFKVE